MNEQTIKTKLNQIIENAPPALQGRYEWRTVENDLYLMCKVPEDSPVLETTRDIRNIIRELDLYEHFPRKLVKWGGIDPSNTDFQAVLLVKHFWKFLGVENA